MSVEQFHALEALGLQFLGILLLYGMVRAVEDVIAQSRLSHYGVKIVRTVLFLGCASFFAKGIIHFILLQS